MSVSLVMAQQRHHARRQFLFQGLPLQRQLLAFIRAQLYQPAILVLDEATSSVDSETEELITRATQTVTANRTSIVIAHRLATIQNADRIIVLDHGRKMEEGNHQQLLKQNGLYKELYEIQFVGVVR